MAVRYLIDIGIILQLTLLQINRKIGEDKF